MPDEWLMPIPKLSGVYLQLACLKKESAKIDYNLLKLFIIKLFRIFACA